MKILVVHASAGAGHMKAAEAVCHFLQRHSTHQVSLVDALDHTSRRYKRCYRETYAFLITWIPAIWGGLFAFLNISWLQPVFRCLRRWINRINAAAFHVFLEQQSFDVIISTHFMPTEVAARLKRQGRIASRLITVVTDFDVHRIWLAEGVDVYAVASDWTRERMRSLGVSGDTVVATGIPVHERFVGPKDRKQIREALGLRPEAFTVLMATGSFGIGPMEAILDAFDEVQVMVVCGHNAALKRRLEQRRRPVVRVMGLVDNMPDLMAAADVMVTKPGGLSISEALVSHLPLIFFNAIPGQETRNVVVLRRHGIGIAARSPRRITALARQWADDPALYAKARQQTEVLARPMAARDVARLVERGNDR